MLQLAGVDLVVDNGDGQVEEFIENFMPDERTTLLAMPWLRRPFPGFGLQGLTVPAGFTPEPKFKINKFYYPPTLASSWAYGHFLCRSDDVSLIMSQAQGQDGTYNKVPFDIGNPESNDSGTIVAGEGIEVDVYVLPPTPLSGIRGLSGNVQSMYLLTIVDQRFFWWYKNFGAITISSTTQWTDLITNIGNILGLSEPIDVDAVDPAYLQPSIQMFSLPYEPIPPILDAIAFNIGCRVVVAYTGAVFLMKYQTSLDILNGDMTNSGRSIISGGQKYADPL